MSQQGCAGLYLLVSGDFVKTGGMDRANYAFADHLAKLGIEVHLVAYRIAEDLKSRQSVIFHRVPKIFNSYFISGYLLDWIGRYWAKKISARGGRVLVNGANCSWDDINWVLHLHCIDRPYPQGSLLHRLKTAWFYFTALREERAVIPRARLIFTPAEKTKNELVKHLGVHQNKIHSVYLGIDSELFKPLPSTQRDGIRKEIGVPIDQTLFVFIGALGNRRKGMDVLFKAWKLLYEDPTWNSHLLIVGRGIGASIWKAQTIKQGLEKTMTFVDFLKNLPQTLGACDALVLPSRYESYSMVAQEALCCEIPAFVTLNTGIAERYPSDLRFFVLPDAEDAKELANRLKTWRENQAKFKLSILSFAKSLRDHTWEQMSQKMFELSQTY